MLKKLLSTALAAAMLAATAVMPAHAATFSSANKSSVAYNLNAPTNDSNLTGTSDTTEVAVNDAVTGAGTRESWGNSKVKNNISNHAGREAVRYYRNNDAYWNVTAPKYIHQRVKLVWGTTGTNDNAHNISFALRTDTSGSRAFITKIFGKDRSDVYFEHYNKSTPIPQNENSRYMYNAGAPITICPQSGTPVENTMDIIINLNDNESKHKGMVYLFFNGKLCVYAKAPTVPEYFYGWSFQWNDAKASDYLRVEQVAPYGHTEYRDTNDYVVTFEDVLNDAGLMTDDISSDTTKMMQVSGADFANFMPDGDSKVVLDASDVNSNNNSNWLNCQDRPGNKKLDWNGTAATVVHTTSDASAWDDKVVSFLGGVYPQTAHGVSYSSYHPRAKYIQLSFDQTITSGTLRYNITRGSTLDEFVRFQENEGKLAVVIPNNERGKTTTYNYTDSVPIDIILEPIEENGNPVKVNVYVKVNGELANSGYVSNTAAVRINDITLSTKGNATVTWDNIVYTLYNENATAEALGIAEEQDPVTWNNDGNLGYEIDNGEIAVKVKATTNTGAELGTDTRIITAIYDNTGRLVDAQPNPYVSGQALADETVSNVFTYSDSMKTIKAFIWDYTNGNITPLVDYLTITIE